jgi:AcrR family transcriptional regulator
MAFRKLDNIDEKIIDATIALGAIQQGGRGFATKDIAERCRISEYVIFKHFGNKQNLLALADKKVGEIIAENAQTIAQKSPDLDGFSAALLAYFIAHSDLTFFSLNYGHGVPHASETQLVYDEEVKKAWAENGRLILKAEPETPAIDCALAWQFLLRNLLNFAGFILLKNVKDTPENRKVALQIMTKGVRFTEEKAL